MHALDKLRIVVDQYDALFVLSGTAVAVGAYLVRALSTGVTTVRDDLQFRRHEEPREYWGLVLLSAVAFAAVLWLDVLQLR